MTVLSYIANLSLVASGLLIAYVLTKTATNPKLGTWQTVALLLFAEMALVGALAVLCNIAIYVIREAVK